MQTPKYDVFISYDSADKQVADAVCHYLEEQRLRCFIAPRDIVPPDWAGSISAAIEHSRAFVIVVSENSIHSNEVAKEITLATRMSSYIFPFRLDDAELDGRMNYHLSAFHWIDAITPPIEKRLRELTERVVSALADESGNEDPGPLSGGGPSSSRNRSRQRLLGESVSPRAEFIGRERELAEIDALFAGGSQSVFLTGMGGIGKSEIAKAYAKAHGDFYTTVVSASYETDLLHLITSDAAVPVENLAQATAAGGQAETLPAYFERKMGVLRALTDEHTLIIIDNFDTENDDHLEDVLRLPCRLLWTTRTDFSGFGYETIKIGPMEDFGDLVKLFTRLDRAYTAPGDVQAVEEIIRLLDGHTYAVSLTAAQMKAGRIKPAAMLEQLKERGLNIHARSGFAREAGARRATAYEYIQALFDFSQLDESSCQILRDLSCMPRDGIDIDLFMECTGVEDFGDISRLIDLNWVQEDTENDRVGLHMLVREMVRERLAPSLAACRRLLDSALERTRRAWFQPYEENSRLESMIYALLEAFPEPEAEVLDHFEAMATFAWIQGNFELAERCERKLFALCEGTWGTESRQTGNQALRVAAVFHNAGDYARARPWYEKGWQILRRACGEDADSCWACVKVGRSDAQNGDLDAAREKYEYAVPLLDTFWRDESLTAEQRRDYRVRYIYSLLDLAHIYAAQGRCGEALPMAEKSYDMAGRDKFDGNTVYNLMGLAYIHYAMGDYDRAAEYVAETLEKDLPLRGERCLEIMFLHEMQGDALAGKGDFKGAEREYSLAIGGREKYFPADGAALERLEFKSGCAREGRPSGLPFLEMWQ